MKKLLLIVFFIPLALSAMAQDTVYSSSGKPISQYRLKEQEREQARGFDKNKLIFGGGFTFGASGGLLVAGLSPVVGYRITDNFSAGIGLSYTYYQQKLAYSNRSGGTSIYKFKTSFYTGSLWARYLIWQNVFVHAEPQISSWQRVTRDPYLDPNGQVQVEREQVLGPALYLGGGIRQPLSERMSFVGMALYDVLGNKNNPYNRFDIRFGVNVGF
ncbi:hypothetical protein [Polluticoccus soli]|uniref:hypothetical protein n=1 Tax=Polluticoccus soli TaxID=3034150 RepID=UPI0023E272FC|nr:hypothetical protein [Flavipsychrobacter sp. JY13-12]